MATIAIELKSLGQIYDWMDPAPFHDKALDPRAEEYILSCAREHAHDEALALHLHVPAALLAHRAELTTAIHAHFRLALVAAERRYRQRMRVGRATLVLGLVVLAACMLVREFALGTDAVGWRGAAGEGLLILGWVALWRPVEVLLFERWEIRQEHALLRRLARMPVELFVEESGAEGRT
jgi:uncharacterized membrane protein YgdD (TMEM256/DUF423 family)